jgi:hypothetical protein
MLRPIEAWSSTIVQKPELKIHFNKGCWLRTITKNNKESYSDIWIPNLNLLMKERKKLDIEISESEEIMESFIKDNIIMNKEFNSLNIFESIQELLKMLPHKYNKLFIEIDTKKLMSLSKYKRLIREEMQKM